MSYSSLVSYVKLSPNHSGQRNHKIDTITIHCMAGNLSVESCGSLFANPDVEASSNYGIGSDGRIACYVEEENRSWCSSSGSNDHRAITIEVANTTASEPYPISTSAYNSLINLCADICKRNGISKLVWSTDKYTRMNHLNGCNMTVHRDYANKSCPGNYLYGAMGQIANDVNKRLSSSPQATTAPSSPVTPTTGIEVALFKNGAYRRSWTVTARSGLNQRKGAGTSKEIIQTIPYGAKVQCYGYYNKDSDYDKWLYVVYKGQSGYCYIGYLE